ncbi:MAG: hypothetical protein Q4E51_01975 [Lachnospiraceae bacterium]|nr:hypothetical protein [Lachnospiraceae bacterium]
MSSRFEQIIEEIEDYIDGCKYQPLSNTKILVDKERLDDLLRDLRTKTPDEVKRYQKIISNKEAILADAREKANALISEAQAQTDHMLSEHEIMQQAYTQAREVVQNAQAQAQQIVDDATNEANAVRQAAMQYTDDSLANLQNIIGHSIDTAEAKYGALIEQLRECEGVINRDRAALYPQVSLEADIASLSGDIPADDKKAPGVTGKEDNSKLDLL